MQKKFKVKITFLKECPYFEEGQEFILENDEFFRMMNDKICVEAWDNISRYVHSALKSGSNTQDWINDEELILTCCNDSPDPMRFKLERIDG